MSTLEGALMYVKQPSSLWSAHLSLPYYILRTKLTFNSFQLQEKAERLEALIYF